MSKRSPKKKQPPKNFLRERLVPKQEWMLVFVVGAIPVQVWAYIGLFREIPALLLRAGMGDIIGTAAYVLSFALFESIILTLVLVLLAAVLPASWFRARFVVQGSITILVTTGWAILAQYNLESFLDWQFGNFLLFLPLYLISIALPTYLIHANQKAIKSIEAFISRLVPLSTVYTALGVISVIIVLWRNFTGKHLP